jgi:hypothetical protein
MNCYVCFVETGCESRPALAVCQRCGAGACRTHLVESAVMPVTGLAGESRSILMCCRCARPPKQPTACAVASKQMKGQAGPSRAWRWNWWSRFWRRGSSELPQPEEAVAAVERFLSGQQNCE